MNETIFKPRLNPRHAVLAFTVLLATLAAALALGPIAQDPLYHNFIDKRALAALPHAADVLSNLPFCLFGLLGLAIVLTRVERQAATFYPYLAFFVGVFLTGFGSAWYHVEPNNVTLVWDRLPMAIAFMGIFSAILAERVDPELTRRLFPWLLALGVGSVFYWHWIDDLRPYLVVQFGTLLALAFMLLRYRCADTLLLSIALGFYLLAKVFEVGDEAFYLLTAETISGHTLKHLAASVPALLIAVKLQREHPWRQDFADEAQRREQ